MARRKGNEWFVGAIAPAEGKFQISLGFLESQRKFTAKIFSDFSPNEPTSGSVKIEERFVDATSILYIDIPPNGGAVIQLSPVR